METRSRDSFSSSSYSISTLADFFFELVVANEAALRLLAALGSTLKDTDFLDRADVCDVFEE